jgi:hypothetical protein
MWCASVAILALHRWHIGSMLSFFLRVIAHLLVLYTFFPALLVVRSRTRLCSLHLPRYSASPRLPSLVQSMHGVLGTALLPQVRSYPPTTIADTQCLDHVLTVEHLCCL